MPPPLPHPQSEVLIAEDSGTQAEAFKGLLESAGYSVRHAAHGRLALAAALEHKPALVISDALMPEMDGFDFCRAFKNTDSLRSVPVILLTSLSGPQDIVRGLTAQADCYLTKPYDQAHLLERIEFLLAHPVKLNGQPQRIEAVIDGQNVAIQADPQQILNLLLVTYDQAVQQNRALLKTQLELHELNEQLEQRVAQRTATLAAEIAEHQRTEASLLRLQHVFEHAAWGLAMADPDESVHLRKDGTRFPSLTGVTTFKDASGRVLFRADNVMDITERKLAENERARLLVELQAALAKVKTLTGLLPICASCKKIRDDKSYWRQVDGYIAAHTEAPATHGICPDCLKKLYPELEIPET
jgi:DNA-binding response OmpR family regulator